MGYTLRYQTKDLELVVEVHKNDSIRFYEWCITYAKWIIVNG